MTWLAAASSLALSPRVWGVPGGRHIGTPEGFTVDGGSSCPGILTIPDGPDITTPVANALLACCLLAVSCVSAEEAAIEAIPEFLAAVRADIDHPIMNTFSDQELVELGVKACRDVATADWSGDEYMEALADGRLPLQALATNNRGVLERIWLDKLGVDDPFDFDPDADSAFTEELIRRIDEEFGSNEALGREARAFTDSVRSEAFIAFCPKLSE